MLNILKTDNGILSEVEEFSEGVWIRLINPTMEESMRVASHYKVEMNDIRAALDDEEISRVDLEEDYTLILVDIPFEEVRNNRNAYTTIPLGIIMVKDAIITISTQSTPVLFGFMNNAVKGFSTKKRMRFVYQILFRTASAYQMYLRDIDRRRTRIESSAITKTMDESDVIDLHELESNLVYFATSLNANKVVLERLTRYEKIEQYEDDKELLEDVIVETKQAMDMTNIYRDIIHGTRELLSTMINNRLNNTMKFLTSITLVMAIPTVISGIYGMNLNENYMPFATGPWGFAIICGVILIVCAMTLILLRRKKML